MNRYKTAAVSAVTLVGYPVVGVLAFLAAAPRNGWPSSEAPMAILLLVFLMPAVLTAITTLLSGFRVRRTVLLVFGTIAGGGVAVYVLLAIASAEGSLS